MATESAKPRVWAEDEIKLLIELAQLKTSAPLIAKLVRHLARCANGVQCGGDDASTSRDIHALLRWVWVDDGPFRKQAPYSDSLSVPGEVEQDL